MSTLLKNQLRPNGCAGHVAGAMLGLTVIMLVAATAVPAHASQNKIGKATLAQRACGKTGLAGGTCYRAVVSGCAEVQGEFAAALKINEPPQKDLLQGTVFFTTGGGGDAFYDSDAAYKGSTSCPQLNCGLMVVQSINTANYRTVQIDFRDPSSLISEPSGWLTGPSTDGPRALACRYATIVHAVWFLLLGSDTTHPVCATGNSGGSALVTYAITQYGMGNKSGQGPLFTFVEPTSGPPYGRIDHGCAGTAAPILDVPCAGAEISEDYGLQNAAHYVDPAYPSDVCTVDINSNGVNAYSQFYHDSVISDDYPAPSYQTVVRSVSGSLDISPAEPLGLEWYNAVTSVKSNACVVGATHELPASFDGATTIINDVTSLCK